MQFFDFLMFKAASSWIPSETWPFGPGYGESWKPVLLKFLFSSLILVFLAAILRFLFGPKGWLREEIGPDDDEKKPASGTPGAPSKGADGDEPPGNGS